MYKWVQFTDDVPDEGEIVVIDDYYEEEGDGAGWLSISKFGRVEGIEIYTVADYFVSGAFFWGDSWFGDIDDYKWRYAEVDEIKLLNKKINGI